MNLAILQSLPKHPARVVRTDSFAKFQAICGMIEAESYYAAHAACHAAMNGIARTIVLDTEIDVEAALCDHVHAIFAQGPFDALVVPGLTDFALQLVVCRECRAYAAGGKFRVFLDPPRDATEDVIAQRQKGLPAFASFAWPWVGTVTPGRRSMELLPPSCLMPALALGTATFLKGVHDVESVQTVDAEFLDECGVEVFCVRRNGRRNVLGRYREAASNEPKREDYNQFVEMPGMKVVDPNAPDVPEDRIEAQIRRDLDARCAEVIRQHGRNDRDLWTALQRTATSVLKQAQDRRQIVRYFVRCDEETASWGTPTVPVVEIMIEYPKRVKGIRFRFAGDGV